MIFSICASFAAWERTNPGEVTNGQDDDGNGIADDVHGMRCVGDVITGNPMDDVKHGSHCAGTIGAVGNNSQGVVGVAWQVIVGSPLSVPPVTV